MAGLRATVVHDVGESLKEPQSLSKESLKPADADRCLSDQWLGRGL